VVIVRDARRLAVFHQNERVVHFVRVVVWVGVTGPFQVAHRAAGAVVATVICTGAEGLADVVGGEERGAAGSAVHVCRRDRCSEVVFRRHIDDRIVDEDGVELAAKADDPHVALEVLALRVQAAAHLQHLI